MRHAGSGRVIAEGRDADQADTRAQALGRRRMEQRFGGEQEGTPEPAGKSPDRRGEPGAEHPQPGGAESPPPPDGNEPAAQQRPGEGPDLAGQPAPRGMAHTAVRALVESIRRLWANAPRVHVLRSIDEAPLEVRQEEEEKRRAGAEPGRGFLHDGEVYLVADQLHSPADVMTTLFHEALGHYGLRGVFGKRLNPILRQVAAARVKEVLAKLKEYQLDPGNDAHRLAAAEELLADMAQRYPQLPGGQRRMVRRAVDAVRQFLRGLGLPLKMSDEEIARRFLAPARDWVQRGGKAGVIDPATSFSRARAGSSSGGSPRGKDGLGGNADGKPRVPEDGGSVVPGAGQKMLDGIPTRMVRSPDGSRYDLIHPGSKTILGRGRSPEEAWERAERNASRLGLERLQAMKREALRAGEQSDRSLIAHALYKMATVQRIGRHVKLASRDEYLAAGRKPQPNTIYHFQDQRFISDELGRIITTFGPADLGKGNQRSSGDRKFGYPHNPDALPGDIGFHGHADQLGMGGGGLNVLPGNEMLNAGNGAYGSFETKVLRPLAETYRGRMQMEVHHIFKRNNLTSRPDAILVKYHVAGGPKGSRLFKNTETGG